ncbi:MAG: hypothetical protein RL095_1522 [Verrucomicrobiota bacterium]|jgi:carboxypeptidase C (cathepsin A)
MISSFLASLFLFAEAPAKEAPKSPEPAIVFEAKDGKALEGWDMTERPPVVTQHKIALGGQEIAYTATAGRLPIKDHLGNIEAQMFYVAYTRPGFEPGKRPITFAFNGGPGASTVWLHLGGLGPRKAQFTPEGWRPAAPYRIVDNPDCALAETDIVLVDAIGSGWSRPATAEKGRKFWNLRGDIAAFGSFITTYLTRNQRWSSPLFLFGESYGSTRAAGLSSHLSDRGLTFNGLILMGPVLDLASVNPEGTNDAPFPGSIPSYHAVAAYHKKLAPELLKDAASSRAEVEKWVVQSYIPGLAKGDLMTPEERKKLIRELARYIGLSEELIDRENLRISTHVFTSHLLAQERLLVGRFDGRYQGPDPRGERESGSDPSFTAVVPVFASCLNDYMQRELKFHTEMPYALFAHESGSFGWDWGGTGFAETASELRSALVRNPHLKVLVMEGHYDLATPYFAAETTLQRLNLNPQQRQRIHSRRYESGHMLYLHQPSLEKMNRDYLEFLKLAVP